MQQELPAPYKLVDSFQQKLLVWNVIVTKTYNIKDKYLKNTIFCTHMTSSLIRIDSFLLRRLQALIVLILNY